MASVATAAEPAQVVSRASIEEAADDDGAIWGAVSNPDSRQGKARFALLDDVAGYITGWALFPSELHVAAVTLQDPVSDDSWYHDDRLIRTEVAVQSASAEPPIWTGAVTQVCATRSLPECETHEESATRSRLMPPTAEATPRSNCIDGRRLTGAVEARVHSMGDGLASRAMLFPDSRDRSRG